MKILMILALSVLSVNAFAGLNCNLNSLSTGRLLESDKTDGGIEIARSLSAHKYLAGTWFDENDLPHGYGIAIYDDSSVTPQQPDAILVAGSFGNQPGVTFSIQDPTLDLRVTCVGD